MNASRVPIKRGRTQLRPLCFALLFLWASAQAREVRVTLLHFSDYHSHAVPFYDDGRDGQGGIARAIGYLRQQKKNGAIIFSGGDMINKGSPAWSDKYGCAEWPWFNGIVDAMAFGNHDADYGHVAFDRCRALVRYPILSANTAGLQRTAIVNARGLRIGVFAVAGPDFPTLVKAEGFAFGDRIAAAREAVHALRERDHADVVVMIGHEHLDDDRALARAVPGIDVIFGTHSHLKRELTRIEGTNTWFISPSQYLTYISRVEITFSECSAPAPPSGTCPRIAVRYDGTLVRVDEHLPADRTIARRVVAMQRALERDPQYASMFVPVTRLAKPIGVEALGQRAVEVMRRATTADVAISTASSFRQALAPGVVTLEDLRAALPYDNEIVVVEMNGTLLARLLEQGRQPVEPLVVAMGGTIDPAGTYRVATTDYLANVASRYREFFTNVAKKPTGLRVRDEVRISFAP